MKMRKIVAILAAALMLLSIMPISTMAAEDVTIALAGSTGTLASDSSSISWTSGDYSFVNYKGSTAIRTSDTTHYRVYAGSKVTISGGDMSKVVITATSSSYAGVLQNSSATGWTIAVSGSVVTYTATSGAESELSFTASAQARVKQVVITPAETGSANCDHASLACGDTCPECGTYIKAHKYSNTCVAECENGCGTANPDYTGHAYTTDYDATCNVCGDSRDVTLPATPEEIVDAAYALGTGDTFGVATTLTGNITEIVTAYDASFANITVNIAVIDSEGNTIDDKLIQCYRMKGEGVDTIEVGDTITVTGIIKNYKDTIEFDAGCTLDSVIVGCVHEYACTESVDPTCTEDGSKTYVCGLCGKTYTETLSASGHNYVDDVCGVCGFVKPAGYAPVTSADQLVSGEYVMVVETGYAPTYLDGTWVLTGQPTITDGVISTDAAAGYLWTLTVNGSSVTITDANGVSIAPAGGNTNGITTGEYAWNWSFEDGKFIFSGAGEDTVYLASNTTTNSGDNKFRAYKHTTCASSSYSYKFTLYAASTSSDPEVPECTHEWDNDCDTDCNLGCGYTRTTEHVYDDEYDADCNVCGDTREVEQPTPENPVDPENPQTYTFADFAAGTQYAENEKHYLDNAVTVITNKGHFTTQLRLYSSSTNDATAVILSTKDISAIVLNAGNKVDVLNVYISEDGEVYEEVKIASTTYENYTVLIPEMTKYIKLDVAGTQQVRIASMTLYFDGEAPEEVVCTEHTYTSDYDATCNTCNALREVTLPEADSTLTIPEANALGSGLDEGGYTTNKYYVSGVVTAIDDTYGNTTIQDAEGNTFYSYGLNNFSTMEEKPVIGDTVTLYGVIGNYKGDPQTKYADVTELVKHTCVSNAEHECTDGTCTICGAAVAGTGHQYFYDCDAFCMICGEETRPEAAHTIVAVEAVAATCAENGNIAYWHCSVCNSVWADEALTQITDLQAVVLPATGEHTHDDEYDADCNVCGEIREVPEKPVEVIYGDVDGNGEITTLDVLLVQQFIAGWDVTLGPKKIFNDAELGGW